MDMHTERIFEKTVEYIRGLMNSTRYPLGHPFMDPMYNERDILFLMLVNLKLLGVSETMIKSFVTSKLVAVDKGIFDTPRFFQGLSEVSILNYILVSLLMSDKISLNQILDEPISPYNSKKLFEYTLITNDELHINIEVKTITCDPLYQEDSIAIVDNQKFVKKFFNDVNLEDYIEKSELAEYKILEASTHYRQVSKNLKKIAEKFDGNYITDNFNLNIGVVVIQFATSMEEFFSYMFNPEKGLIHSIDFKNLDSIVFFSLTPKCDLQMQDIYDREHLFTVMLNNEKEVLDLMKELRLDLYAFKDGKVHSTILEESKKKFGRFKMVKRNGLLFFCDNDKSEDEIEEYIDYLS